MALYSFSFKHVRGKHRLWPGWESSWVNLAAWGSSRSELSRHQKALQCVTLVNNKHSVRTWSCCCYRPPWAAVSEEILSPFVPLSSAILSSPGEFLHLSGPGVGHVLLRVVPQSPRNQSWALLPGHLLSASQLCSLAQTSSVWYFWMFAGFLEEVERSELSPSLLGDAVCQPRWWELSLWFYSLVVSNEFSITSKKNSALFTALSSSLFFFFFLSLITLYFVTSQ